MCIDQVQRHVHPDACTREVGVHEPSAEMCEPRSVHWGRGVGRSVHVSSAEVCEPRCV